MVVGRSSVTCGLIFRVLHLLRCLSIVMVGSRWFLLVHDSFSSFCMDVAFLGTVWCWILLAYSRRYWLRLGLGLGLGLGLCLGLGLRLGLGLGLGLGFG